MRGVIVHDKRSKVVILRHRFRDMRHDNTVNKHLDKTETGTNKGLFIDDCV